MTPERWQQIKPIFDAALELPAQQREPRLRALCGDDEDLLQEVASLLKASDEPNTVLDGGLHGAAIACSEAPAGPSAVVRIGARIGAYRLIELVGRGGMGEVYRAERADDQYHSQVAIKLVRTDQNPQEVAWRFKSERQILAALEHRNIARLVDGGATADGVPYLVIEFVSGEPIDKYCEAHGLDIDARVRLFLQVCAAVSFAHQRLVVHRDLKPSNILVTADGSVKLLDFGIAKLLEQALDVSAAREATATQWRAMTLDYASPEQVRGAAVTTVSDVYSLGVVLYRLLTGLSPYRTSPETVERAAEIVSSTAPSRPSIAVAYGTHVDARDSAPSRPLDLRRMQRALRGDLDNVLLMALRKEPQRRYASVDQLAADLRNHLEGRPVFARGDAWRYRASKFVARHRYAVAAGALCFVALLSGIVTTTWQARIAAEQSRIAHEEMRKQRAVQSFLGTLFDKNTRLQPDAAKARNMPVRELLVTAGDRVLEEFSETPAVHIEVLNTVARLLLDIDEFERAGVLWTASVRLARQHALDEKDAYVDALIGAASAARLLGRAAEAVAARDEALAVLDARKDDSSLLRARALTTTAAQLAPDPAREIALLREGVALFEARYPMQPAYFSAVYTLAHLQRTQGDNEGAAQRFVEATRVFEKTGSRDYTTQGASYAWGAFCQMQLGRVGPALRDYETGIALLRQHAGDDSIFTRVHLGLYAAALHHSGRTAKSREYFAVVLTPAALARPTVVEFDTTVYRASALMDEGRVRDALAALEPFAGTWLEFGKRFVPNGVEWLTLRARAQAALGLTDAARGELERIDLLPAYYGKPARSSTAYVAAVIEVALQAGDLAAAQAALADRPPGAPPQTLDLPHLQLATAASQLLLKSGDPEAALSEADAAISHLSAHAGGTEFPFVRAALLYARGAAHAKLRHRSQARTDLQAAVALMARLHAPESPLLHEARALLLTAASG